MATVSTSKLLSETTYATAETITITNGAVLTVDATNTTRPGNITCLTSGKLSVVNSSPDTPLIFSIHDMTHDFRFEGNGIFEVHGAPTGGTYTLTVYDADGVSLGSTSALAYNATTTTIDTALEAIAGVGSGNVTVAGTNLTSGFTITFGGTLVNTRLGIRVDGTALTGGTEPGKCYARGQARLIADQRIGSTGLNTEFAMRVPGYVWPSYQAFTKENLIAVFNDYYNNLTNGYNSYTTGFEFRVKLTAGIEDPASFITQISIPTTLDPSSWIVGDATINIRGTNPTDITTLYTLAGTPVATFTGSGVKDFNVGSYFNELCYFTRQNASSVFLASTYSTPFKLKFGSNGNADLFVGPQVQLAESSTVSSIKTSLDTNIPLLAKEATSLTISSKVDQAKQAAALAAALSA